MAYIDGNAYPSDSTGDKKRITVLLSSSLLVGLLLKFYPGSEWETSQIVILTASLCTLIAAAYFKMNPVSRMRVFRKDRYRQYVQSHERILEKLALLDDAHFILTNLSVEFFHVKFVIISCSGIYIITGMELENDLTFTEGLANKNRASIDKTASNLWRVCYFLNIVFKKSFKIDSMPRPIMVIPETEKPPSDEYDGISIISIENLLSMLKENSSCKLSAEQRDSIAYYLLNRYVTRESPNAH
ncbi:MAG: hypothetical protein EPN93_13660 [Spirochaetes bacterium]|nr:MAG: hypothetical protein EPN93_13660 [Spirochaetota bacterium]